MAFAAADAAPWVRVEDREALRSAGSERVVKVVTAASRLLPSICGVAEEHAQKVPGTSLAINATVLCTGMQDRQVMEELDVALLPVDFSAEAPS
jgi:hypothetical protein